MNNELKELWSNSLVHDLKYDVEICVVAEKNPASFSVVDRCLLQIWTRNLPNKTQDLCTLNFIGFRFYFASQCSWNAELIFFKLLVLHSKFELTSDTSRAPSTPPCAIHQFTQSQYNVKALSPRSEAQE